MKPNQRQLEILRHSLGLDMHGRGNAYRNHYCIPVNFESEDLVAIRELVDDGLMFAGQIINEGRDQYFHVSDFGRLAAVEGVKPLKLTKAQRRYRAWLDLDMGIPFKTYLTHPDFADSRRRA